MSVFVSKLLLILNIVFSLIIYLFVSKLVNLFPVSMNITSIKSEKTTRLL